MAFCAILIVGDSLFTMFVCHACLRVFMTVVTGIFFIVTGISVTGFAAYPVIAVEPEITIVVECSRFPLGCAMAVGAAC